jgi:hypothetical protein
MTANGAPVSCSRYAAGAAMVAVLAMKRARVARTTRRRRRKYAMLVPNTPSYTWASSSTTSAS